MATSRPGADHRPAKVPQRGTWSGGASQPRLPHGRSTKVGRPQPRWRRFVAIVPSRPRSGAPRKPNNAPTVQPSLAAAREPCHGGDCSGIPGTSRRDARTHGSADEDRTGLGVGAVRMLRPRRPPPWFAWMRRSARWSERGGDAGHAATAELSQNGWRPLHGRCKLPNKDKMRGSNLFVVGSVLVAFGVVGSAEFSSTAELG